MGSARQDTLCGAVAVKGIFHSFLPQRRLIFRKLDRIRPQDQRGTGIASTVRHQSVQEGMGRNGRKEN